MDYWDIVLQEVLHKNDPAYPFAFTNFGYSHRCAKRARVRKARKEQLCKEVTMILLGDLYPEIHFTQREADCMYWLLQGCTLIEVAEELDLSPRTVEYYVKNMKLKLRCRNKAELVNAVQDSEFLDYYYEEEEDDD